MRQIKNIAVAAGLIGISVMAVPAQAEVLRVTSLYPAKDNAANLIGSIAVEPFRGADGSDVGFAIEKELSGVNVRGAPYFEVLSYRSQRNPDGLIKGFAEIEVYKTDTKGVRNICVEYDATKVFSGEEKEAKCIKRKNTSVDCVKRTIALEALVSLSALNSARENFLQEYSRSNEQTSCPFDDERGFTSKKDEKKKLVKALAIEIRDTLAPIERNEKIRVLESRKGMTKAEGKAFKAGVKMTKRDAAQACTMWRDMADNGTAHVSLAFNLGLCAEQSGELSIALNAYRDAETRFGSKSELRASRRRVENKLAALDDWEERQAALYGGTNQ